MTEAGTAWERTFMVDARAVLFGFDDTHARARIMARGRSWRIGGAARTFGLFALAAPVVAIFPPHAVWFIGALVTGSLLARRRYVERYTLVDVDGTCPKCSTPLTVKSGRLKQPHPMPCETCNHEPTLRLADGVLTGHDPDREAA